MSRASAALGLGPEPSAREVKEAYRNLSLIHHPDVGGDTAKFQVIHKAYVTALAEAEERPCASCKGKGKVPVQRGWSVTLVPCEDCGGLGYQA